MPRPRLMLVMLEEEMTVTLLYPRLSLTSAREGIGACLGVLGELEVEVSLRWGRRQFSLTTLVLARRTRWWRRLRDWVLEPLRGEFHVRSDSQCVITLTDRLGGGGGEGLCEVREVEGAGAVPHSDREEKKAEHSVGGGEAGEELAAGGVTAEHLGIGVDIALRKRVRDHW